MPFEGLDGFAGAGVPHAGVLSHDHVSASPSPRSHTARTPHVCPLSVRMVLPALVSHTRAVLSSDPVSMCPSPRSHTH